MILKTCIEHAQNWDIRKDIVYGNIIECRQKIAHQLTSTNKIENNKWKHVFPPLGTIETTRITDKQNIVNKRTRQNWLNFMLMRT